MKICMVGTGYVGLVSGTCLAETGNHVTCVDIDETKVATLRRGEVPIYEPGLADLIQRNTAAGRLAFTTDVAGTIQESDVVFIAVGTPRRADGGADLRSVDKVAEEVAEHISREMVVVMKSTVPVGTSKRIRKILSNAAHPVHVVSNPEFLKEGDAVSDFLRPDRIVIGVDSDHAKEVMGRVYQAVAGEGKGIVWMDNASAELTKYVSNSMLALRVSFMNEVALLCDAVDADIHSVKRGVGTDSRIGDKFLNAGPGYGGSCFPKDVPALLHTGRDHGVEIELASATHRVNERQKTILGRKLRKRFDGDLRGKKIAVWGVAFKPRTDDIRQSPSLMLMDTLLSEGAIITAHDPEAMENAKERYGDRVTFAPGPYEAAEGADALVLVTEWSEYQSPDFERIKTLLNAPNILDGRNIWSNYGLRKMGFWYEGIGVRGS